MAESASGIVGLVVFVGMSAGVISAMKVVEKAEEDRVEFYNSIKETGIDRDQNKELSIREAKDFIYKNFDKDKDDYISIEEAQAVNDEAKRLEKILSNASGRNIFEALKDIDKLQRDSNKKRRV